ncbi:MAG: adenylyltransferase/cytidyltransferase family protein [Clostridia bacterium]|nr:adenylyltransferase/cytidyltransferase family protein [Clostridia bacterium]
MGQQCAPSVVCLGFFDGVHKGHLALIEAAKKAAKEENLRVCVHTFDHAPGSKGIELTTLAQRERLLRSAGVDEVAVSAFDDDMRHMSGDDFFRQIVLNRLNARHVVCGDDHRFGYKGAWGIEALRQMCSQAGIGLTVVPAVTLPDGTRISSTAIRHAIETGNWPLAEQMLGRSIPEEEKNPFHNK